MDVDLVVGVVCVGADEDDVEVDDMDVEGFELVDDAEVEDIELDEVTVLVESPEDGVTMAVLEDESEVDIVDEDAAPDDEEEMALLSS